MTEAFRSRPVHDRIVSMSKLKYSADEKKNVLNSGL